MKIIPSTVHDYAHVELGEEDEERIRELRASVLLCRRDVQLPSGMQIEISEKDAVTARTRRSLRAGRYFVIE